MRSGYNHSLRSQPLPVNPGGQPHSPVTWLQEVPRGQWHRWAHRFPYEPGKQTERAQMSYSTLDLPAGGKQDGHWGKLLFSQCNPLQPAGQMQVPVMWWHGALWSHLHCCLQPGPYKPWAHADQNTPNGNKYKLCLSKRDILPYGQFLKHYDDFWGTMICFTCLTAWAHPACWTGAPAILSITHAAILTLTLALTVDAKVSQSTFWAQNA